MNILVLGGTGAMGKPLVDILSASHTVYVTSRSSRQSSSPSIHYIKGNAKEPDFLTNTAQSQPWDAIVDFMVRSYDELQQILPVLLSSTRQYVFISSARVYAQSDAPITEATPRLLNVSTDAEYLQTNEYALAKAREEDLLNSCGKENYTIIRPSITYNDYRLQLGVMEKEDFLYRALHGRSIVFSRDLKDKQTTMTHGDDVARGIAAIIGRREALGETFHITSPQSLSWGDVLDIYARVLEKHLGHKPKIVWTDKTTNFGLKHQLYRIKYCRYFNRTFDNSKIGRFVDVNSFASPLEGLSRCLENFLAQPQFGRMSWNLEGLNDRASGEHTPLREIPSMRQRLLYVAYRYDLGWLKALFEKYLKTRKRK